jgi:hypothetical protein
MNDLIEVKANEFTSAIVVNKLREVNENHFAPVVEDFESNTVAFLWEDEEEGEDGWEVIDGPKGPKACFKLRFIYGDWIKEEAQKLKEEKKAYVDSIDETYLHDLSMVYRYEFPINHENDLTQDLKDTFEKDAYSQALAKFNKTLADINNKNSF